MSEDNEARTAQQELARGGPDFPENSVRALLMALGLDPYSDGLKDTPKRVWGALQEMTAGYQEDPAELLVTRFDADYDQMVILRDIAFTSMCEHHMLPFAGKASVGYIPHGKVVGLSKLARVTLCFARRLQLQERLTTQIAQAIDANLAPLGVGVVVEATHQCMACRGVRIPGATMVTSALLGEMRSDASVRAEFLRLANGR